MERNSRGTRRRLLHIFPSFDKQLRRTKQSAKGLDGDGLICADLANGDLRDEEIFAACRTVGETAEHRNLADVRECVGDRPLKETFRFNMQRLTRREVVVEGLERVEKASHLLRPRKGRGVAPPLTSLHRAECPVEEIAHVSEDLDRLASATVEGGE